MLFERSRCSVIQNRVVEKLVEFIVLEDQRVGCVDEPLGFHCIKFVDSLDHPSVPTFSCGKSAIFWLELPKRIVFPSRLGSHSHDGEVKECAANSENLR
eukprot:1729415-Rhodomonas_salina.1